MAKEPGASYLNLAGATAPISTGTSYWVRGQIEGDLATVELWTAAGRHEDERS